MISTKPKFKKGERLLLDGEEVIVSGHPVWDHVHGYQYSLKGKPISFSEKCFISKSQKSELIINV